MSVKLPMTYEIVRVDHRVLEGYAASFDPFHEYAYPAVEVVEMGNART